LGKAGEEIVVLLKSLKTLQQLELAEEFLAEGRGLIDKDSVQASGKLYKAAEEVVKFVVITLKLPERSDDVRLRLRDVEVLVNLAENVPKA
jgi:hypothetical protein